MATRKLKMPTLVSLIFFISAQLPCVHNVAYARGEEVTFSAESNISGQGDGWFSRTSFGIAATMAVLYGVAYRKYPFVQDATGRALQLGSYALGSAWTALRSGLLRLMHKPNE